LHHSHSTPVNLLAAKVLGVLSRADLPRIANLFITEQTGLKKNDDFRIFSSKQRAIAELHFGVGAAWSQTFNYLNSLKVIMPKMTRHILREQVCFTLKTIYSTVRGTDPVRVQEWKEFKEKTYEQTKFNDTFQELYKMVFKWAKDKSKHTMFCLDSLVPLLSFSSLPFWNEQSLPVLKLLLDQNKEVETHLATLNLVERFLSGFPRDYIRGDSAATGRWATMCSLIFSKLFKKEVIWTEAETNLFDKIIQLLFKMNMDTATTEIAKILALKSGFLPAQKALFINALAAVCKELPQESKSVFDRLSEIVNPYIELRKYQTEIEKLPVFTAALRSFPWIRSSVDGRSLETASAIWPLMMNSDAGVRGASGVALHEYASLDRKRNFFPILAYHVRLLTPNVIKIELKGEEEEEIGKPLFSALTHLQALYNDLINTNKELLDLRFAQWSNWTVSRQHVESVCMVLLACPYPLVRDQIGNVLKATANKVFRALEAEINTEHQFESKPYLSDVFFSNPDEPIFDSHQGSDIPTAAIKVLSEKYKDFRGVSLFTSALTEKTVHSLLDKFKTDADFKAVFPSGFDEKNSWWVRYVNEFRLHALSLRPGDDKTPNNISEYVRNKVLKSLDLEKKSEKKKPQLFYPIGT
jgi:hypothetical protein